MKVQRVEFHQYHLVYEYDIPDEEIIEKYNDLETFKKIITKKNIVSCYTDDKEFDDAHDFVVDNYDHEECYYKHKQLTEIKGGYETNWYADDECLEPRGEPIM